MYVYCLNTPANGCDPSGNYYKGTRRYANGLVDYTDARTGNPLAQASEDSGTPDEPDDRDIWDKIADFFIAIYHNLDISIGVGQGLYFGCSLFDDAVGIGVGGYGNYGSVILDNGEVCTCQEVCLEFVIEFALMQFGVSDHNFLRRGETIIDDSWVGYNDKMDSTSLFSIKAYALFFGFSIDIGFDFGGFFKELSEVF